MKLNVKLIIFMWFEFHFGLPIIHLLSMHAWWAIAMYWIQATVTNTHWQHWFNAIQNHFSVKPTMPNNFIRLSGNVKSFHFVAEKSVCLLQCECDFFYVQQFFCIQRIFFLWTSVFVVIQLSAFDTMKITNATEKCVLLGQYRTEGNVGSFYTFSYVLIAFETSERHFCSDFVNKTKQNNSKQRLSLCDKLLRQWKYRNGSHKMRTSSVVCGPYLMINATLPTYIWISMKCDGVLSSTCRRYQLTVRIMFGSNSLAQFKGIHCILYNIRIFLRPWSDTHHIVFRKFMALYMFCWKKFSIRLALTQISQILCYFLNFERFDI